MTLATPSSISRKTRKATTRKATVRFTPDQYFYLSEHNLLGEGRTELINGRIVRMASQYNTHLWAITECADWLREVFPKKRYWVRVQGTLHCLEHVPEPDIAVTLGPPDAEREVMTGDRAFLVVEVADSTLLADKRTKPPDLRRRRHPRVLGDRRQAPRGDRPPPAAPRRERPVRVCRRSFPMTPPARSPPLKRRDGRSRSSSSVRNALTPADVRRVKTGSRSVA
jgi:Uma2 family endonuclease